MAADGRVALVTGAGSGIGRAAALSLARDGCRLILVGRRRAPLDETAALVQADEGRVVVAPGDVGKPDEVGRLFEQARDAFGRLDVLFNNAGVVAPGVPLEDLAFEDWQRVVDVNLTGAFLCAQAAIRLMKAQNPKGGRIINNGSISATSPRPNSTPYTATKHAISGLTKCIALDGRKHDIACSQIDVGNAETALASRFRDGVIQASGDVRVEPTFDVAHVGDAVAYIAGLPLDTNILFMTIMATKMPFVGRG